MLDVSNLAKMEFNSTYIIKSCVCVWGGEGMSDFEGVGEKICPKWGKEKKTLVEKNYRIDFETFCSINSERIMLWVPHRF